jgi:hypothetical protein
MTAPRGGQEWEDTSVRGPFSACIVKCGGEMQAERPKRTLKWRERGCDSWAKRRGHRPESLAQTEAPIPIPTPSAHFTQSDTKRWSRDGLIHIKTGSCSFQFSLRPNAPHIQSHHRTPPPPPPNTLRPVATCATKAMDVDDICLYCSSHVLHGCVLFARSHRIGR